MLAQTNSHPVDVTRGLFRAQRDAEVWQKIEALLTATKTASTREIAEAIGLSIAATHKRLVALRDLQDVRNVPPCRGSSVQAWALCTDADAFFGDRIGPILTKAVQLGSLRRDPLVAALFGDTATVSLSQEQNPIGIDIDAIHFSR